MDIIFSEGVPSFDIPDTGVIPTSILNNIEFEISFTSMTEFRDIRHTQGRRERKQAPGNNLGTVNNFCLGGAGSE